MRHQRLLLILIASTLVMGCQASASRSLVSRSTVSKSSRESCPLLAAEKSAQTSDTRDDDQAASPVIKQTGWRPTSTPQSAVALAAHSQTVEALAPGDPTAPGDLPAPGDSAENSRGSAAAHVKLADVISSVLSTYPMVQAAALQFEIAQGQIVSAEGAFDTKLKGATENGPLGFYETYRHSVGAIQPLANGGEVFGGYRVGRGVFQPWYQERQTNEGGEFKAGLSVPLSRNVGIDDRRAGVQKAGLDLSAADPQFRSEVILTVRAASEAYWQWVAAAAQRRIAEQVLALATTRNVGLEEEVRSGAKALPDLKDNRR